jgi:hypothetical protein
MATTMNSKHNTHFLLSLTFSGAEDDRFIVANGGENSIENFANEKGGTI